MSHKTEISEEREVKIAFEIPKGELGSTFKDLLTNFQKEASVPGFRPGKVPMSLIRQRWGRDLMSEKATEIARQNLVKALEEEKIKPGGRIDINLIEYGEDKPLTFEVTFPLIPEVKLTKYKDLEITVDSADVTEEDIDKQIEALQKRNAALRSIDDPAPANAKLTLKVQEVDPSGVQLIGREVRDEEIEYGMDKLGVGSDEQLMGVKAGEKRTIRVRNLDSRISSAPQESKIITPGEAESGKREPAETTLAVEVVKVEVPELPDLDEDFVKQVNDKLSSVEEMRSWIRESLEHYVQNDRHQHLDHYIVDRLIEDNPFPIAKSYTMGIIEQLTEGFGDDEEKRKAFTEEHFASVEREQRWTLLRDAIAEAEKIEVTDEDVDTDIKAHAEASGKDPDEIRKQLAEDDNLDRLKTQMFEHRIIHFLNDNAKIEERKMPLDEFFQRHQH